MPTKNYRQANQINILRPQTRIATVVGCFMALVGQPIYQLTRPQVVMWMATIYDCYFHGLRLPVELFNRQRLVGKLTILSIPEQRYYLAAIAVTLVFNHQLC